MRRLLPLLTIVLAAALPATAMATPTPAFTVGDSPTVGIPVTFDATATVCDAEPCGYTWRIIDGTRLGITFGRTPVATYTFDEPGLVRVQLLVVNSNPRTGGPSPREASLEQFFTVAPARAPRCSGLFLVTSPGVPVALPADPCSHVGGDPNDPPEATAPGHGEVVAGAYVPEPGFHGVDGFAYRVTDRVTGEASDAATVRVLVDTAPQCTDLARTTGAGQPLTMTGFPPCSDPDGDPVAVSVGDPQHGTLVRDDAGGATYTPQPGFAGTDILTYHAVDPFGLPAAGTLTIAVAGGAAGGVPPVAGAPPAPDAAPVSGAMAPPTGPPADGTAAADTTRPALAIAAAGARQTARGLRLTLATGEAGVARITVTVDGATARRLDVARRAAGRVTVGSLTTRVRRGSRVVVVRLRPQARTALRRAGHLRVRVRVRLTDAAGNRATRTTTVRLRRQARSAGTGAASRATMAA